MSKTTAPPPAPSRQDPATFADRADAFAAWISLWRDELEALALQVGPGEFDNLIVNGEITGTAITQSATDTTPGRVPVFRAEGILGLGGRGIPAGDLNQLKPGAIMRYDSSSDNGPDGVSTGVVFAGRRGTEDNEAQLFIVEDFASRAEVFVRARAAGDWPADVMSGASGWKKQYSTANLVGTVSMDAGGGPNGAIFEEDSNDDGYYQRTADGRQICWREIAVNVTTAVTQTFSFPASFSGDRGDIASGFGHLSGNNNAALYWANIRATGHTGSNWFVNLDTAGSSSDPTADAEKVSAMAVGRWAA